MKVTYDVFQGEVNDDPLWLECADELETALERMKQRAQRSPGKYFVFCVTTKLVLGSIDTSNGSSNGHGSKHTSSLSEVQPRKLGESRGSFHTVVSSWTAIFPTALSALDHATIAC